MTRLEARSLSVQYASEPPVEAVQNVSFSVDAGECLALVGESGSGKSSIAMALVGLSRGTVSGTLDLGGRETSLADAQALAALRGKHIAMVFQDTAQTLNPVRRIGAHLEELLLWHGMAERSALTARAAAALTEVGFTDLSVLVAYPHQLSGGERQRVGIALALIAAPEVLIADEPMSALDPPLQRELGSLLNTLRRTRKLAVLFITHQLPLLPQVAQRVVVLEAGAVVEVASVDNLLRSPQSATAQRLVAALPGVHKRRPLTPAPSGVAEPEGHARGP